MRSRLAQPALARLLCVLLLLVAQHGALKHGLWHASASGDVAHHHDGGHAHDDDDAERGLCAFHAALGSVSLGGGIAGDSACIAPGTPVDAALPPAPVVAAAATIRALPRGPPLRLL